MPLTISLRPNQTPTEGKKSINAFPYENLPPWHTVVDKLTISFSTIQPSFTFNLLDLVGFSNWNSTFASSIYRSTIPSSYFYTFDGTANSITDGGFDMWDGGNLLSLTFNYRRGLSTLNYGVISTFTNEGGYFISRSNQWPQIAIAYMKNGTIGWTNSGNVGTDGAVGSSNSNISGTYATPTGRYGSYWVNQNYGTQDPTICYTWFTIEQENYGTLINSCNDNRKTRQPPADTYVQHFNLTGQNIVFAQTLLSVRRTLPSGLGYFIPSTIIEGFLSTFVDSAVLNFS
jgi:hypothetical protein